MKIKINDNLYREFTSNLRSSSLFPLLGFKRDFNLEQLFGRIEEFEKDFEEFFIDGLFKLGISATVKDDRYSLPYKEEISVERMPSSMMNEAYSVTELYRKVVKDLLNKDINKLRFYIFLEIIDFEIPFSAKGITLNTQMLKKNKICIRFRYYPH